MTVAEMIGRLAGRAREKQSATASSYREIIRAVSAGEPVDEGTAIDVLDSAGKTPVDLERDVAAAQERDRMRAAVGELPELQRKLRETEAVRTKGDAAIASAQATHAALVLETREQSASLQARITGLENYQQKLWASSDDPALRARDAVLNAELQRLRAREIAIDENGRVSQIGGRTWRADHINAQARAKELRAALAGVNGDNELSRPFNRSSEAKLQKDLAAAEQTIAGIEAQKIEPAKRDREAIAKRRLAIAAESLQLVSEMQAS